MDPVKDGIGVTAIKKTKAGKVIIELDKTESINKVTQNTALRGKGLTFEVQRGRKPRVILYDVPRDMSEQNSGHAIIGNNPDIAAKLSKEPLESELEFRLKLGPRDKETQNHVIQVSPRVRSVLVSSGRILKGWLSCKVADYVVQPMCYKCLGVVHISKHCKNKECCSLCGQEGHGEKGCKDNEGPRKCGLCRQRGESWESRDVMDKNCPSYKAITAAYKASIDYRDDHG